MEFSCCLPCVQNADINIYLFSNQRIFIFFPTHEYAIFNPKQNKPDTIHVIFKALGQAQRRYNALFATVRERLRKKRFVRIFHKASRYEDVG
jgi:hypothetical protein